MTRELLVSIIGSDKLLHYVHNVELVEPVLVHMENHGAIEPGLRHGQAQECLESMESRKRLFPCCCHHKQSSIDLQGDDHL